MSLHKEAHFKTEILTAVLEALEAHTVMRTQALDSKSLRMRIKDILLNYTGLYEEQRNKAGSEPCIE